MTENISFAHQELEILDVRTPATQRQARAFGAGLAYPSQLKSCDGYNSSDDSLLLSRRGFVTGAAAFATSLLLPDTSFAAVKKDVRKLKFDHTHTGESMDIVYWANGKYVKDGLKKVNYLLRDFRNGKQKTIDPKLLDRMVILQRKLGSKGRFEIVSAYRSPQTNKMLRRHSSGVAKNSYHLQAKAIDIRLTDVDLYRLREAAIALGGGGVGIYTGADFLHLDTGPERSWG